MTIATPGVDVSGFPKAETLIADRGHGAARFRNTLKASECWALLMA